MTIRWAREGVAAGEPVLTEEESRALGARILRMVTADHVEVEITHTVRQITRIANNRVLTTNDGADVQVSLSLQYGNKSGSINVNQLDAESLEAAVRRAESVARAMPESPYDNNWSVPLGPQQYQPVTLWRESSAAALAERPAVATSIIETVHGAGLIASGTVVVIARSTYGIWRKEGTEAYVCETDCECAVGARAPDGKGSGWDGQANRDWARIDAHAVAARAVEIAEQSHNPVAVEPGRRTVILSPQAVAQFVRGMAGAFLADETDRGNSPFSKPAPPRDPNGVDTLKPELLNKLGLKVFDPRITMTSDPNDPEGGYPSFFSSGFPQSAMTWVEQGMLKNLAYSPYYAMERGKQPWADIPRSFRLGGGPTTVEEMIQSCEEGIYVNRIGNVDEINDRTGLETGVTRDGCFLVKHGKIDRPVLNFRFVDSPWFVLNNLIAIGTPVRAALGYVPGPLWPLPPLIVPPMMVRDFNFTSLTTAI